MDWFQSSVISLNLISVKTKQNKTSKTKFHQKAVGGGGWGGVGAVCVWGGVCVCVWCVGVCGCGVCGCVGLGGWGWGGGGVFAVISFDNFRWMCVTQMVLTHWGRVTHICVGKPTIIDSNNGLSPGRRQAIIWTNAEILLIRPLGTKFSEI